MQPLRELLELGRFFSRGLGRGDGQPELRRHPHERPREIIKNENHTKPMTDQLIALHLAKTGARISWRTVAKYHAKYHAKLGIPGAIARAHSDVKT